MASSIIHLAVTKELTKRYKFKDENRLKFGAILPDAGRGKDSHVKKAVWGLNKRVYDFERFRAEYGELMKSDDLYLGYYLHLVQDICGGKREKATWPCEHGRLPLSRHCHR